MVDLPFALPTAVAGIALTTIYAPNGLLGRPLVSIGIHAAYTPLGVTIALTFIGLPFVVRTVQPVLEDLDKEFEEAAASLGAGRWRTFTRVLLPTILPAAITGFAMAFGRAVGEYGSVIFIAGNMPMRTEITPLLIITKLQEYDYTGATAIAVAMLVVSFVLLLVINLLQVWSGSRRGTGSAKDSGPLSADLKPAWAEGRQQVRRPASAARRTANGWIGHIKYPDCSGFRLRRDESDFRTGGGALAAHRRSAAVSWPLSLYSSRRGFCDGACRKASPSISKRFGTRTRWRRSA